MFRYAVLWEFADTSKPVGLVVERQDCVAVELPNDYGMPKRYDREYRVLQPDMTEVVYRPGDEQYFDHVVIELSRQFALCDAGQVDEVNDPIIDDLLQAHVLVPRTARRRCDYPAGIMARISSTGACGRPLAYRSDQARPAPVDHPADERVAA